MKRYQDHMNDIQKLRDELWELCSRDAWFDEYNTDKLAEYTDKVKDIQIKLRAIEQSAESDSANITDEQYNTIEELCNICVDTWVDMALGMMTQN